MYTVNTLKERTCLFLVEKVKTVKKEQIYFLREVNTVKKRRRLLYKGGLQSEKRRALAREGVYGE